MLLINEIQRQNVALRDRIDEAVRRVLDSGWYILGPEVRAFEEEFAAYCGARHCVTTGNGTDALELALKAIGVGRGDRVGTVANAGMYGTTAILRSEATPVFLDVHPQPMLLSPSELARAEGLRAVIVTHLYGQMADMPALLACGVPIIEDCAQAHGAQLQGRTAGSWGVAGCFSFYPTKNLGALGDGGAVVTSNSQTAERLRSLRQYGWTSKYVSEVAGGRNSRMDEMQAAILRCKLPYLDEWNHRRRVLAGRYNEAFGLTRSNGTNNVAHLYVIRSRGRKILRTRLAEAGIATEVHYPVPDYRQASLSAACLLPVTEKLCEQVLTLPLFPEMTDAESEQVIGAVLETGVSCNESN